jgi:O-antigen ligase
VIDNVIYLFLVFTLSLSVWAAYLLPKAPMLLLCLGILVIGTLFGPAFFAIEGPLQISADRILFAAIFTFGCIQLASGRLVLPQLTTSDYLVGGIALWFLLSALTGGEPVKGINPRGTWVFYVLMPACIYALVRIAPPRARILDLMTSALIGLGVYLAVTGFFEARGWYSLVLPKYIADPKQWEFLGRARGPLLNPSANGVLLTIALSFVSLRFYQGGRTAKVGYGIIGLIVLLGVYSTLTRSVWIGALVSLVVIFWTQTPRWTKVLGLASLVVVGGLMTVGLKDQLLRMKRDKNLSAAEAEKSVQLRPLLAVVAYEMLKDAPLTGHGFGNYARNAQPYCSIRSYDMPLEQARGYVQHNIILSVAADTGLIGLTLFSALLIVWIRSAWRLGNTVTRAKTSNLVGLGGLGAIVAYLVAGMFQDVIVMPMIQMYLYFVGALVVTVYQQQQDSAAANARMLTARASDAVPAAGRLAGGEAYLPAT